MVRTVTFVKGPRDPSKGRTKIIKTEVYKSDKNNRFEKVYERLLNPETAKSNSKINHAPKGPSDLAKTKKI